MEILNFILTATVAGVAGWWLIMFTVFSFAITKEKQETMKLIRLNHSLLLQKILDDAPIKTLEEEFSKITPEDIKKEALH